MTYTLDPQRLERAAEAIDPRAFNKEEYDRSHGWGDPSQADAQRIAIDKARAAISAYLGDVPDSGWQPIETAPKDGADVLVMNQKWLMSCPAGYFSKEYFEREYSDPNYMEEGWYPSAGFLFDLPEVVIEPTHWMPLPSPPNSEDAG